MSKPIYRHEHKHRLWIVENLKPSWSELSNPTEYIRIMCVLGRHTRMSNNDCLSLLSIHDLKGVKKDNGALKHLIQRAFVQKILHACFKVLTYASTVDEKLKQNKT